MENRTNETRNENQENTKKNRKKGKKGGLLKKLLITVMILAILSPIVSLVGVVFTGISYIASAATRDWFTVVGYVDETHITLADNNGKRFDIELVGCVMKDETALSPYIGTKVYVKDSDAYESGFGTNRGYVLTERHTIIQIEMLVADTACMSDETHFYRSDFYESDLMGEYCP